MKKLILLAVIVLAGLDAYCQTLDTIVVVGSGINNSGGDSKLVTQQKTNLAIVRQNTSAIITTIVSLDSAEICGTAAGAIGSTGGAILVAAPGAAYALEFLSAILVMDFVTAAYTGGSDDATIRVGAIDFTPALTDANYLKSATDSIYVVYPLATAEINVTENGSINLSGTAFTDPGTADGQLRVHVMYRRITTGL